MNGLSQSKAKQVRALQQKKNRSESGLFLVEGAKAVVETLNSSWPYEELFCTDRFLETSGLLKKNTGDLRFTLCTPDQLSSLGSFQSNNAAILIARQKSPGKQPDPKQKLWLAIEEITDPGNLGTIIRLADWFGLNQVICLGNCVEWYNPKVIAGTMGSFLRIRQIEMDAEAMVSSGRAWFAADANGSDVYDFRFPEESILLIGNESKGLRERWLQNRKSILSIPSFGKAESLNAAMATGILLNHWRFGLHTGK